ncbi:putative Ca2 /H antiporter VCX1 [Echria macrotheca]|uniref:Vacuolar calcium ion transporter n=1 Tax=Echria macrotheca TaxID=438768 RepID=A0AAJ0BE72_9PEZI|nr:putative Ca2 /H antiporter VCX1 [Echria macrotheca]
MVDFDSTKYDDRDTGRGLRQRRPFGRSTSCPPSTTGRWNDVAGNDLLSPTNTYQSGDSGSKPNISASSAAAEEVVDIPEPFTVANQLRRVFFSSWLNILLLAAPAGIALHFAQFSAAPIATFVVNAAALMPLSVMLSFATDEVALRAGNTIGGLLNVTFGNAVELIVSIVALLQHEIVIVQTALVGSILSNLLLVLGVAFLLGGARRSEQHLNRTAAETAAGLLAMAVAGVMLPTVFDLASSTPAATIAHISRGTSVILLIVYGAYLVFQLRTHRDLLTDTMVASTTKPKLHATVAIALLVGSTSLVAVCAEFLVESIDGVTEKLDVSREFIGLVLLPIVGNVPSLVVATAAALRNHADLAIVVTVGASLQVALFVLPLVVVVGWGLGIDGMTLSFDVFQVTLLFVSVLLVNFQITTGRTYWLSGALLIQLFAIVATCSWWYPSDDTKSA